VVKRCQLGGLRVGAADPVAAAVMDDPAAAPNRMAATEREDALEQLFARLEADKQNTRTMEPSGVVTAPLYPHQKEALVWWGSTRRIQLTDFNP
jgi:SWI/SNF-related matrix-associated actin-dependent regulator of chromatin subfamily A3